MGAPRLIREWQSRTHEVTILENGFHCLKLGSVYKLKAELDAKGITSKRRSSAAGKSCGGRTIAAGALYQMLRNPIYCGRIGHKGQIYEGEHEAIIEAELWESVQRSLAGKRNQR